MANIREIQSRMKSIQDTMKITNAMYMISSTKLRKARKSLEKTEPYFFTLQSMVTSIVRDSHQKDNIYFDQRKKKKPEDKIVAFVVVTADKGLAGSYNHNVLKKALEYIRKCKNYKLFVVGETGRRFFKNRHISVEEYFNYTAQNPSLHRARVISEIVLEQFKSGEIDRAYIIYTSMKNSITTEISTMQLLPLNQEDLVDDEDDNTGLYNEEILFNPSADVVLNNIVPDYVMGYIYGALVESFCSEHNSRMMAMEAANKNATVMVNNLSTEFNRVRQAMITQEITEIIAGAKAQKKKKKKARKEGR